MKKYNKKILIVEDSKVDSYYLKKILEQLGYYVSGIKTTGEDAIKISEYEIPDLVLMDIELGGELNGIETSFKIRNIFNLPVIFTTAHSDTETLEKVKIINPYGYLIKPMVKKDLYISIELALNKHELEKKLKENEIKYKTLFEESKDAIYINDESGKFIDFNKSMLHLFGYEEEEMEDLSLKDLIVDVQVFNEFNDIIKKNNYVEDFQLEMHRKNGTKLFCLITSNIIQLSNPPIHGYQGIIRDITEKKRANDELELLNITLKQKIKDLDDAKNIISLSEKKYKLLVEGSNDIIFSLDENWNFMTVNKAITTHLNINPDDVISKNFFQFIYARENDKLVTEQILQNKLESFSKTKKPIIFKADFISHMSNEPKEMNVKLEYINIEGKNEILGKASRILEDELLHYLESENQKFIIGNYLTTAEEVCYRITRNLKKFFDSKDINFLRLGLREIIINAIEHGNLNISFDEKTEAIKNSTYFNFVALRQNDPKYSYKKVTIEYAIDSNKIVYIITDQGNGFNYKKMLKTKIIDINTQLLTHGRGINITQNIFDQIKFNRKGNKVILIKFIKSEMKI